MHSSLTMTYVDLSENIHMFFYKEQFYYSVSSVIYAFLAHVCVYFMIKVNSYIGENVNYNRPKTKISVYNLQEHLLINTSGFCVLIRVLDIRPEEIFYLAILKPHLVSKWLVHFKI